MALYSRIVSLAESPEHAWDLFWEDRLFVVPILIGSGLQVGLFRRQKIGNPGTVAAAAAGGGMSTAAIVAC